MRWVIGDIHGMNRPLQALLAEIARHDPWAHLLFVGDYVNRGPDSAGVLETLTGLGNAAFIRGNHDDVLDLILHGTCYAPHPSASDPVTAFVWFMQHGLDHTLASYGADWAELEHAARHPSPDRIKRIAAVVPEKHRRFIRKLPATIEHDDLFVAHGFWDAADPDDTPGGLAQRLTTDARLRQRLLWGRFEDDAVGEKKRWKRTGYFGHTPVEAFPAFLRPAGNVPIRGPGLVLLDTGAALGLNGRLTAVCADSGDVIQADRSGAIVTDGH